MSPQNNLYNQTKFEVDVRTSPIVTTPGTQEIDAQVLSGLVDRHATGDWGDTSDFDGKQNDSALEYGDRVLSIYHVEEEKLYVITEADRSVTTIMFAWEY